MRASLDRELLRTPQGGVLFFTVGGEPRVSWFGQSRALKDAGEFWQIAKLTDEEAARLAAELRALMERYGRTSPSGRPFLSHAAFAPRKK